ncbi:hypothetical protein B0H10DRAFT_1086379 [Mycena sp. CBHHK59/15]|nr:hypothetical protein B0H10DRAFT_1086379 [Mycena sp. CBHHK59/15]
MGRDRISRMHGAQHCLYRVPPRHPKFVAPRNIGFWLFGIRQSLHRARFRHSPRHSPPAPYRQLPHTAGPSRRCSSSRGPARHAQMEFQLRYDLSGRPHLQSCPRDIYNCTVSCHRLGMERCTLDVVLPEASEMINYMNFTSSGSSGDPDAVMVEMWRVSSPEITEPIDPRELSWETRPQRKLLVGYWDLKPGAKMQSETFECTSNSLHTFEFICLGPKCHLQFQQDPNDPRIGEEYKSGPGLI